MQPLDIAFLVWQGLLWLLLLINHLAGMVTFHRLKKHVRLAHEDRHCQFYSDNPWVPELIGILKLNRYCFSDLDDEDSVLRDLKKRHRTRIVIFLSLFSLSFISVLLFGLLAYE